MFVASGERIESSITAGGEVDQYTIDVGSSRPLLVVNVATTSGSLRAVAQIIDPNGHDVSVFSNEDGITFVDADVAGTYVIRIRDSGGGTRTGSYRMTAFTPSASVQADDDSDDFSDTRDDVNIDSGRRYAATAAAGDLDMWRVEATEGQAIGVTVGRNDAGADVDPDVSLIAPDGSIVARKQQRIDTRATQTGVYYAIVNDGGNDDTGVYGISFTRAPGPQYTGDPDTLPLASGTDRGGDLPSGDTDVFAIFIEDGATLAVDFDTIAGGTAGYIPTLSLYAPDGRTVRSVTGDSSGVSLSNFVAPIGGTYYLGLRDDDRDGGGQFTLRYDLSTGNGLGGSITDGTLLVNGTGGDDSIMLTRTTDDYDVIEVNVNGTTRQYFAGEVTRIEVQSGDGNDRVNLSTLSVRSYVSAGSGDDTINGGSGDDTLTAGAGRNRVYGGSGADRLNGSGGRDFLYGEAGDDRIYASGGNDYIDGGGNVDRAWAGDGDDSLIGGSSNDRLFGENGNDTLAGGKGTDYLFGGDGDDFVANGGEDGDILDSVERT